MTNASWRLYLLLLVPLAVRQLDSGKLDLLLPSRPQVQLQNYRKQIEQHEANKQQTIAALSSEVVRLSQKMEEEKRKAAAAQVRLCMCLCNDNNDTWFIY